jgi:hypothetical protein
LGNKKSIPKQTQSIKHTKEKPKLRFKDFKNPFAHSKAESWGDMEIIHYTMDAFQAWLKDQQTKPLPSDTPVEQLQQWQNQYPDAYDILHYLYSHHTHAGFGKGLVPISIREHWKAFGTGCNGRNQMTCIARQLTGAFRSTLMASGSL